ncbi:hypothetical protein KIH87_06840 [Paraneptunicella aestuarii]|uniref:DUF7010 family protein n=1 Tax=Paraneptunicella aestuarii TaxID=2831148 RepID=UPI001E565139|nr:hypothetical protein [Paraneptunicella aestuarii]UAA40061.1 hypothetical protein KIH87_06840 [Paraneptunicella aestuarii]
MSSEQHLEQLRQDFERTTNRAVSLPISGAIVWTVVGIASLFLNQYYATLFLLFATGAIFPMALGIAKLRKENITSSVNPLSKLMALGVLMVNLLWAVHVPLMMKAPQFVPLSVGIGLGLHWIVYSWIVQHPVGIIHAIMRTVLCVLVWLFVPVNTLTFIAIAVVVSYAVSIYFMLSRDITGLDDH